MFERLITTLRTDDAAPEDVAATRERLKAGFPPGAVRRMTQLGMLVSNILNDLAPSTDDTIVYATQYAESRTLETYLESFPAASPTGFQTSIHPGAVQQAMIRRAQPVGEFFPVAGGEYLVGQSLVATMISPAARVVLCGGEERGSWLAAIDGASERAYAYGMILEKTAPAASAGASQTNTARLHLEPSDKPAVPLAHSAWFDLLHARKNFSGTPAPGWRATLEWL